MAVQTFEHDVPFAVLNHNNDATQSRLEANPLTAALGVAFADFRVQRLIPVYLQELERARAVEQAKARAIHVDGVLNVLVKKLDHALLILVGNDRDAPLYDKYFGDQRPFEVSAPLLGPQLEKMRGWIKSLLESPHAALAAIGGEIQDAVADADAVVAARKTAEEALADLWSTGERAQMVHAYNALRKATFGKLGELQHQHPYLPASFPDTFFLHEIRKRDDKLSSDQIQGKVDALRADLATWEKKLERAQAREQAEAETKTEQAAKAAALAEKRKQAEALAAEIKKLEGEVNGR